MTSPYLDTSSLLCELTRALRSLDDLADRERRLAAYVLVAMKYDKDAVRIETIRRMGERNAPLHRKRPVAVDIVENQTPERVLVRRPASA